jgi:hypothetical protein
MPRETSAQSESESERVPSKKQKKREESPADDPMDEDVEDKGEGEEVEDAGEEEEGEEYEIAAILDSSKDVFPDVCPFVGLRLPELCLNIPRERWGTS